jgi:hypothetical protein
MSLEFLGCMDKNNSTRKPKVSIIVNAQGRIT